MTHVYLVEDSPILTKLLTSLLEAEPGVRAIGHADNAPEATTQIAELRPDILVLDLHLRQGTGIDVIRALRQTGTLPKFVVLTNHFAPSYRKAALDAGAHHCFDKSTGIPRMLSRVRMSPGG